MNLIKLRDHQVGKVTKLCMPLSQQQTLLALGIYPGALMERIQSAPMGDPILFFIRGSQLALRMETCEQIEVEELV